MGLSVRLPLALSELIDILLSLAWNGAKYVNPLLEANIVAPVQSDLLDTIYAEALLELQNTSQSTLSTSLQAPSESPSTESTPALSVLAPSHQQQLLLTPSVIPKIVSTLELPAIAGTEILRAIEQVKHRLQKLQG
jgi:hypothetical protein